MMRPFNIRCTSLPSLFMCMHMYKIGLTLHIYFVFMVFYTINYTGDIFLIVHNPQTTYKLHIKYGNTINNFYHLAPWPSLSKSCTSILCYEGLIFKNLELASAGKLCLQWWMELCLVYAAKAKLPQARRIPAIKAHGPACLHLSLRAAPR